MAIEREKARKPATKAVRASGADTNLKPIEKTFRQRIDKDRILNIQISIASVPAPPVPPRPKKDELVFHCRLDKNQILTMNTWVAAG